MDENFITYDDALCNRQKNGKYSCKLFKEPKFLEAGEVEATINTPEGQKKVWVMSHKYNKDRKYDIVDNITTIDVYTPHYMGVYMGAVVIEPSKKKIMNCKVINQDGEKILRCYCENPVMIVEPEDENYEV